MNQSNDPINVIYDPIINNDNMTESKIIKLQKQVAYTHKDHPIYKYRINIPSEIIQKLGWEGKMDLEIEITKNKKLEISKIKNPR